MTLFRLHPKSVYVWGVIGTLLLAVIIIPPRAGRIVWQTTHLAGVATFFERDAKFALDIGNYYFNVGGNGDYDLDSAEKYFTRALRRDPNVPDAWHQLARIDFLRGDFSSALEKINKQIELHGDSFMASYYIRGLINGYAGNLKDSETDFKKFLEWDPQNWAADNDLAWIYFRQGRYEDAERIAEQGLAWAPDNPWLLTSLGVSLLNLERKKEAKIALKRAQMAAQKLTETDWHKAYPGNDPQAAAKGLANMQKVIDYNLGLVGK